MTRHGRRHWIAVAVIAAAAFVVGIWGGME